MSNNVHDQEVQAALAKLKERLENPEPAMAAIGEELVERTKQRFASATAPDGTPWRTNSAATVRNFVLRKGGYSKKTGKLLAKGEKLEATKKPLQGISRDLARQIFSASDTQSVTMGSSMIYAAMQHYGGNKSDFPQLWGDIPARQFMPMQSDGTLYPTERHAVIEVVRQFLDDES